MPRRNGNHGPEQPSKKSSANDNYNGGWGGFIDIHLAEDEKILAKQWIEDNRADIWVSHTECMARGLKYGCVYDPESDVWLATYTGAGVEMIGLEARYCMTARGHSWEEATALLVYKETILAKGDWKPFESRMKRFEQFG